MYHLKGGNDQSGLVSKCEVVMAIDIALRKFCFVEHREKGSRKGSFKDIHTGENYVVN